MRQEINEFDIEKVVGGIKITRHTTTSGIVYYNGREYPFNNYSKLLQVAQQCVDSGTYDDDTLFKAFKDAHVI